MADVTVDIVNPKQASVGFTKKINLEARGGHKYESEEYSFFSPLDVSDVKDNTDLAQRIEAAFSAVKVHVFNQAGVEFTIGDDGVVRENIDAAQVARMTGGTTESAPAPAAAAPAASGKQRPLDGQEPCDVCGSTKFWNNRADKASGKRGPTFPDLRCAGKKADGKPCGKGRWDTPKAA